MQFWLLSLGPGVKKNGLGSEPTTFWKGLHWIWLYFQRCSMSMQGISSAAGIWKVRETFQVEECFKCCTLKKETTWELLDATTSDTENKLDRNLCGKMSTLEGDVWKCCSVKAVSAAAAEAVSAHVAESGSRHILHMGTLGTAVCTFFPVCC